MKWYNPDKGFGFIARDSGGKDISMHVSALTRGGLTDLSEDSGSPWTWSRAARDQRR